MIMKIKRKDWNNPELRNVLLNVAELLGQDVEVEKVKCKFKKYNVQIWQNDDIIYEKDFDTKPQAKRWIKKTLLMKKCKDAYADLKKYNKSNDDFDYWFYKLENNKLIETSNI